MGKQLQPPLFYASNSRLTKWKQKSLILWASGLKWQSRTVSENKEHSTSVVILSKHFDSYIMCNVWCHINMCRHIKMWRHKRQQILWELLANHLHLVFSPQTLENSDQISVKFSAEKLPVLSWIEAHSSFVLRHWATSRSTTHSYRCTYSYNYPSTCTPPICVMGCMTFHI